MGPAIYIKIDMTPYYETAILEAKTSKGFKKFWQGFAVTNTVDFAITSHSWQKKADGTPSSKLISTPKIVVGKNIGKSNEVNPRDQARFEIMAKAEKKISGGYNDPDNVVKKLPLPMLAHTYSKRSHDIDWDGGVYVQPKLDGTRMLFNGSHGWSRQGKPYIPEVIAHLACQLPKGVILDGELMLPLEIGTFQDSMRAIKKFRPGISNKLIFHVYDMLTEKGTFEQRTQGVAHLFYDKQWNLWDNPGFHLVDTMKILREDEITDLHAQYVEQGFEGIMIRNAHGVYKIGHRSVDLQKLKHFVDDEFEIVDVNQGTGKEAGCAIFECQTKDHKLFNVRPCGTLSQRKEYYNIGPDLVGQMLTVRFQELTDDGIPRFPVGVIVRNYEAVIS